MSAFNATQAKTDEPEAERPFTKTTNIHDTIGGRKKGEDAVKMQDDGDQVNKVQEEDENVIEVPNDHDKVIELLGEESSDPVMREVTNILSYFSDYGEIVWFKGHQNLNNFVITQPTAFVKSLRTVITHKVKENFREVKFKEDMQDLLKRGCLSFKSFREAYNKQEQEFEAEEAWRFMKELGLAFPFEERDSEGNETVMIPCLIKDDMEEKMKRKEREMEKSDDAICLMYEFDCNSPSIWKYYKLLEVFAKTFLAQKKGEFHSACSQKIEKRRLGTVAGIQGTFRWTNSKTGMQKPMGYSFLLLEYEN